MTPLLALTIAAIVTFLAGGTGIAYTDQRITDNELTRDEYDKLNAERERWKVVAAFGWYIAIFSIVAGIYQALAA